MVPRDAASALDGRDGASKAAPLSHRDPSPQMLGPCSTASQKTSKLFVLYKYPYLHILGLIST